MVQTFIVPRRRADTGPCAFSQVFDRTECEILSGLKRLTAWRTRHLILALPAIRVKPILLPKGCGHYSTSLALDLNRLGDLV